MEIKNECIARCVAGAASAVLAAFVHFAAWGREAQFENAPYMDASLAVEERVDDLLSHMTLAEKVAQLCTTSGFRMYEVVDGEIRFSPALDELYGKFPGCGLSSFFRADWFSGRNWERGITPAMMNKAHNTLQRYAIERTRLGIPLSIGCGQMLGQTTMPCGLACAATFDVAAITNGTRAKIEEFRSATRSFGIGHPTCDLALDPRWSRVEQTFGEDPFLSAEINYARCRMAHAMDAGASLAHFVAHGFGEGGRMSMPVHVGDNELYNLHLRPFEYAVRGGATSVMTCYNLVDGVPGILRGDLVNGFVRGTLGFKGVFVADAGAIGALPWQGFAKDLAEAAALAVKNGNDKCCWEAENYLKGLTDAIGRGLVTEAEVDCSVRRVLSAKFRRGLFERPYVDAEWNAAYGRPEDVIGSREHRDVALDLARKAVTLLENPMGVLPFDAKKVKKLAVIGPNADKAANQLGDYTAPQEPGQTITPRMGFEALGKRLGFEVVYAKGCSVRSESKKGFPDALAAAKGADAVVLCIGGCSVADSPIRQNKAGTAIADGEGSGDVPDKDAGEGFDRATLRLGGVQLELLREVKKLGKPVVTVLIIGRPIVLADVVAYSDAVLLAWYPGCEGGTAISETVFGLNNPGGRLPVSFPRGEGAIPCCYHYLTPRGNYVDMPYSPLYSFGYGLSYTKFEVSNPVLVGNKVRVSVKNAGARKGDDVVQMYLRDVVATVARPRWELKGFRRVSLEPGETKEVVFELTEKELGYWNRERKYVVEEGEFLVAVSDCFEPDSWLEGDKPTRRVVRYVLARREKVMFDTDIGGDPDDALALQYLLKEPRCELLGVTTVGKNAAKNAEIAAGLCRSLRREDVKIVPGGPKSPATAFLSRTIRDNPSEVTLLATAPFTNVAALFERDPGAVPLLKRLVVMGGNLDGTNYEWNAFTDVAAAKTVFEGRGVWPPPELVLFGAEVTTRLSMSADEGRAFMAKSPDFSFVRNDHAEKWYGRCGRLYFHDPIAAVAIFHPEIAAYAMSAIRVDENDRARTRRAPLDDPSGWRWRVAMSVNDDEFLVKYLDVMAK